MTVMETFGSVEELVKSARFSYTDNLLDAALGKDWKPSPLDSDAAGCIIAVTAEVNWSRLKETLA